MADELRRLRLRTLQWQIHPHFLFNALTTIQAFVRVHPVLAEEMIGSLAQFVRATLARADEPVSVADELALVRAYLALERVRLGRRLRTLFDIDTGALDVLIPALLLQPLVENAVIHAAAARVDGATLRLIVRYARGSRRLLLMVADDGPGLRGGLARAAPLGRSYEDSGPRLGVWNLRLRLETLYGSAARLRLLCRPRGGTIAAVSVPVDLPRVWPSDDPHPDRG